MKSLSTIIFAVVLFVSCNSRVSFSERCDARSGYGLNGPVESVEYEEVYSDYISKLIGRYDLSQFKPYAKCTFNKSGNIVEKYESNGNHDYDVLEKTEYDRNGMVKHREITEGKDTEYIDFSYETISDTLIVATYRSNKHVTKLKVRYDSNGNIIQYEPENGYIVHSEFDNLYNPWLFKLFNFREEEYGRRFGMFSVNRSANNSQVTKRVFRFGQGESVVSLETRDEYDSQGRLLKAIVIGGWGVDDCIDAGVVEGGYIQYTPHAPITVAEYHYDNSHPNLETACTFTDKNDRGTRQIIYAYEYDRYDNWVSRLTYTDGELCRIEKRTIKYYGGPKTKSSNEYIAQAQRVMKQQERHEEQQRLEILRNPIVLQPYVCEFYDRGYNAVGFRFKADAINRSDRTFIDIKCYDEHDTGMVNLFGNPITEKTNKSYVALYFNKNFIIRGNHWDEPVQVSFNHAWKPQETKTLEIGITPSLWDDDSITIGHTQFVPKQGLLHIEFVLEDIDGKRTTVTFEYDLKEIWHDFANSVNKK